LEFDLLVELARRPGQVLTREELLEEIWGYRHQGDARLVNVHVQLLRAKVEKDPDNPEVILTVRGVGYKAGETMSTDVVLPTDPIAEQPKRSWIRRMFALIDRARRRFVREWDSSMSLRTAVIAAAATIIGSLFLAFFLT